MTFVGRWGWLVTDADFAEPRRCVGKYGIIADKMKPNLTKAIAAVAATGFSALAVAGIVLGRDWRLALAPIAVVPALRMFGDQFDNVGATPRKSMVAYANSIINELAHTILASAISHVLAGMLSGGRCPWAAGAVAAATTMIAVTPLASVEVRYPAVRLVAMLAAATSYAAVAFATDGSLNKVGLGSSYVVMAFVAVRTALAVRDWRKGAAA